jgi:transposase
MAMTLLSVREAAARLNVHENTLRNWESRGLLKAIHLPYSNYRRFDEAEISRMQREMRTQFAPTDEGATAIPRTKPLIIHGDSE